MADLTKYPLPADLMPLLAMMGVTLPETAPPDALQGAIDDAVSAWEQDTDYAPFLGQSAATSRTFTRPEVRGKQLSLNGGLVAAPTSVVANGVTLSGDVTGNCQYWLKPDNAPARGKPYEWIEFLTMPWIEWGDTNFTPAGGIVVVTGKFGYSASLPREVWTAILWAAAAQIYVPLWEAKTNGLKSIAIGGSDLSVSFNTTGNYGTTVRQSYEQKVGKYRRRGLA